MVWSMVVSTLFGFYMNQSNSEDVIYVEWMKSVNWSEFY